LDFGARGGLPPVMCTDILITIGMGGASGGENEKAKKWVSGTRKNKDIKNKAKSKNIKANNAAMNRRTPNFKRYVASLAAKSRDARCREALF